DRNVTGVQTCALPIFACFSPTDCPFKKADELIEEAKKRTSIIFVDFHGEATSEKQAMGWYLDGRVSAVVGTHTHTQTADNRILRSEERRVGKEYRCRG